MNQLTKLNKWLIIIFCCLVLLILGILIYFSTIEIITTKTIKFVISPENKNCLFTENENLKLIDVNSNLSINWKNENLNLKILKIETLNNVAKLTVNYQKFFVAQNLEISGVVFLEKAKLITQIIK
ncbi:MAG1140 family protein [Mycoplasmopsis gallinarum]|uniref:MAG1140 family protein n=1 Tax=Mycoplasmopsis gallinarum TaxID=29557 RepID=UPI00047F6B83|nr:hypothetical protein [Mycoplasmopsis gallinarum]